MAATFSASSTNNTTSTANVSIVVSPDTAVISETSMLPGDSASGVVNVSNVGDVDLYYYVTADWKESGTSSPRLVNILANTLNVSVDAGSPATTIYAGTMAGLIDQPDSPGRALTMSTGNENVTFTVILPSSAGNILQNLDMTVDFVFVSQG